MTQNNEDSSLGRILVDMRALSAQELVSALHTQREARGVKLGDIAHSLGYCTAKQVQDALEIQRGLRSPSSSNRAQATAKIAIFSKRKTRDNSIALVQRRSAALTLGRSSTPTPIVGLPVLFTGHEGA